MQPFDRNGYGPKIGGYAPFGERELGPHDLTQCSQGRGLSACQVSSYLIRQTVCPQYTNVTDIQTGQTVNGPIA